MTVDPLVIITESHGGTASAERLDDCILVWKSQVVQLSLFHHVLLQATHVRVADEIGRTAEDK